ncbi:uncharacterized protein BT62DRAFT_997358 [Guyanagaster necrorhizus]|uniref:Uncharacterized protein n=1 Tax=Guyanagaster necrorhizus TaxID=856835 RepID=A0A9P8AMX0_9AGAR|nr:uncharacterized protein BT62DRAFT_997358 [Guyanagaster necrorhizus MCA 3950]KAG7441156.1 hypothetical protein BT62DRAFT_997358 [Guyanagaster necrorhizus MCA 3950]
MTPSHYSPLRFVPASSADSLDVSLLDSHKSSKPQTRVSYGRRRRISIAVIIPGILTFAATAGLASSLLAWLLSRRVKSHIPREDPYFLDAVVAIEGTRAPQRLDDGSLKLDTTMYGLAISSLSAQLVALTVPFLLGLLGYRLASMWILAQEKVHTRSMPTAIQYGLLVKLCGSANLCSAYETVQYLKRGRERRSQAPPSLVFALIILILAIALNHLLSAADLWLHTTASTFVHTSITEIAAEWMPAVGTKLNLTACPGPTVSIHQMSLSTDGQNYSNCAHFAVESASAPVNRWGDVGMITEGLAVVGNSSSTSRTVMIDDVAILVPSTMPDNVDNLTFNSFGLVAHCQPVVNCLLDPMQYDPVPILYCPSFNPPYNISSIVDGSATSRIDMLNLTNNALSLDGGYPLDSVLNPYGARVIFYWSNDNDNIAFPADDTPGWYQRSLLGSSYSYWYMSTCNMTAYNVSLSYSTLNGSNQYAFVDGPVASNFNTTSALFAALDSAYQENLVDYLQSTLETSFTLPTDTFNTVLSRNMSYAAMGLASPLLERDVSAGGNAILLRSASRYPLAPLSTVLAILYTYALLTLVITASSVMLSSREIVVTKDSGEKHRITTIELVQLRLANPLASIAERFIDPAQPELLLESSAVDMFYEHPRAEKLGVVMVEDEEQDAEGMIRRRRGLRVESVERKLTRLSGSTSTVPIQIQPTLPVDLSSSTILMAFSAGRCDGDAFLKASPVKVKAPEGEEREKAVEANTQENDPRRRRKLLGLGERKTFRRHL